MWLGLALDGTAGPSAALEEYERARRLDPLHPTIANNLANMNTTGYKRTQLGFEDLMYLKLPAACRGLVGVQRRLAQLHCPVRRQQCVRRPGHWVLVNPHVGAKEPGDEVVLPGVRARGHHHGTGAGSRERGEVGGRLPDAESPVFGGLGLADEDRLIELMIALAIYAVGALILTILYKVAVTVRKREPEAEWAERARAK